MKRERLVVFFASWCLMLGMAGAYADALTYQECILDATRKFIIADNQDIGRIKVDCETRFPDTAPQVLGNKLNADAMSAIEVYTHGENDGSINGTVFNGNSHIILTRLLLLITPKRGDSVMDFFDSEEFEVDVKVQPKRTGSFRIEAEDTNIDGSFSWKLVRAWGY